MAGSPILTTSSVVPQAALEMIACGAEDRSLGLEQDFTSIAEHPDN